MYNLIERLRFANKLFLLGFCLFSFSAYSQSDTLINYMKEGGFELGNGSFAANGWSIGADNVTQVNQWTSGRGAQQGFSGRSCAYITDRPNDTLPPHHTTLQQGSTVHFYRDIRFPAGKTVINLYFMYINAVADAPLRVALVHRDSALTTGITLARVNSYYYNYFGINLDPSVIGNCSSDTTWRLVFSWSDTSQYGSGLTPPAVDNINLTAAAISPAFAGADTLFTIDKTRETSGTNFKNFKDAITALNLSSSGFCSQKPLIFNVISNQVFEEVPLNIYASGTALAPIVFRKSGTGANPVFKPKPTNYYEKYGFYLSGSDFITFDGIDIDGRLDSSALLLANRGYFIENASPINGAQNNTIKNCNITLDRRVIGFSNLEAIGISQKAVSQTPSAPSGTNSMNRFLNLNIHQCDIGIRIEGSSFQPDSLIEIGTTDPKRFLEIGTAEGDNITSSALYLTGVRDMTIHHVNANMPFTILSRIGHNRLFNNKIVTFKGNFAVNFNTQSFWNTDVHVFDVFNNFFSMPRSQKRERVYNEDIVVVRANGNSYNSTFNFYNNSVFIDESLTASTVYRTACLSFSHDLTKIKLLNNIFANATQQTNTVSQLYCVVGLLNDNSISNYNAFWRADTSAKIGGQPYLYIYAKNLNDWQSIHKKPQDLNSVETNPVFLSGTDLHTYGSGIDGKGTTPPNDLLVDIDNEPRTAPFDIGADQFMRQTIDLTVIDLLEPNDSTFAFCENLPRKIKVQIKNLGTQTLDFTQTPSVIKVIVTKPIGKDSFFATISTGTLGVDSSKIVELGTFISSNYGIFSFKTSSTTLGDAHKQNDSLVFERSFLAPKSLPLVESFEVFQNYQDWTFSAGVGFLYRGKTGNGISAIMPSTINANREFRLPKLGKITDTATFLNFEYRIMNSSNYQALPNSPNWGKINILASTDCGTTYTVLKVIDSTNHQPSDLFQSVKIPLSNYMGNELVLKFALSSKETHGFYIDFDDFYIGLPCRQLTGMDSILIPAPIECVGTTTSLVGKFVPNNLFGTSFQWQYSSDSMQTWVNTETPTSRGAYLNITGRSYPIHYRIKTTCATDNSVRLSNIVRILPAKVPTTAQIPYKESFENWQTGLCTQTPYTNDLPSSSWFTANVNTWRRNDEGDKAAWQNPTLGGYTPNSSAGQYSARFHSYGQYNTQTGALDLKINLSGATDKQIAFDYINTDGKDGLKVSLSKDGGITFLPLDTPLSIATTWRRFKYMIPANSSPTSVFRFEAFGNLASDYFENNSDIGLDSLTIENITTAPPCIALTSPQNGATDAQDDQLFSWQSADYATGYRIKIGTTANGSDVLPLTDIGFTKQYRYPNFFDYQKTYYATLEPYNKIGTATGCPTSSFTIGKNPNFGGGRTGLDSLQPFSGGYTFANSTTHASNAPNGKAVFSWIDPTNHTKITSFNNSNGYLDGYYQTTSAFPIFIYGQNTYNNALNLGSNGILSLNSSISNYNSNKIIPSNGESGGIVAACYTQLYRGADSKLSIKSDSTQFVATWWHFYATNGTAQDTSEYITFQIILKPDGSIKIQYNAEESSVGRLSNSKIAQTALVGIEGYNPQEGYQRGIQYRNKGRGARLFDAQNKSLALEFQAPIGDLASVFLLNPSMDTRCIQDVAPTVLIQNLSFGRIDFSRNPATIQIKTTGVRTQTITQKVNSGILYYNAALQIPFSAPLSMDTAGTYDFEITVKNDLDQNATNDTFRTFRTVEGATVALPYLDNFNTITEYSNGNGGGFSRITSDWSLAAFNSPGMRLRKGDYLAFDYRMVRFIYNQPESGLTTNDWEKIQIGYTTGCNYNFNVLDSIMPHAQASTLFWRQKALRIPDSLAGKRVVFQAIIFKKTGNIVMDIDNFYVGRACDSTQIDIGNITAPPSVCQGDALHAGVFQRPIAPFMQYNWQYSTNNGTSWSALTGAEGNNYMLPQTNLTATYRVIGTCTLTQKSDTTDAKLISAYTPDYAQLPYNQSFETWETASCNYSTTLSNDIPDAHWLNLSQVANSPWRRNDQGSLGGWSNASGAYTPASSQGSYSARFNSTVPYPPVQSSLYLFVNLDGTTDKTLSFDYLNKTGSDSLRISWSTDGCVTFKPLSNLNLASSWTQYSYSLIGGTAQTVIRFEGVNLYQQYGSDDIGLDNVRVFSNNFTNDAAISAISPQLFGCQNAVQPLTVKLRNAGIEALNLATTPITVNVSVSGVLSRSFTKTVNTGSLAVGTSLDVVLDPSFTLSAVGIYNIDASLVSTADLNAVNNTLKTQVRVVSEKTIPFLETFDASPNFPLGWVTEGGVRVDTSWRNNGNFRLGFYMSSYDNPNLSTKGGSFTMPKIGIVRANDVLSFDAFIARYNEGLPNALDWGSVEAVISDDCGQTWKTVWTANGTNFNSSILASNIRIPLSNYVGKSIIVRFTAAYKSDSYFIWFDNFRVDTKCIGAPTIAPITGNATACYGERVALQTAVSSGIGLTWAWQKQDTSTWVGLDTNKVQTTTFPLFLPTQYRVIATCLMDSTTATSAPFSISVAPPVYAQLPYRQDFESWQSCSVSNAQALPDASWAQQLYTSNGSWRRNDNGTNADWTNPNLGAYTPLSTTGNFSARFHTTQRSDIYPSNMDFYVDMSQISGTKYIALDYNNGNPANGLYVLFSKDGGKTFDNIDRLEQTMGWRRVEWALNTDSSQCILRFSGQGSPYSGNTSDIGLDNLTVSNRPMPLCVEWLSPSAWSSSVQSDAVMRWQSSTNAKGYKIKIGTTQNGSEFLPLTDVGRDTFFKPTNRLAFLTTYYVSVIAYDSMGNSRSTCYQTSFTTQRNPNFGGGVNGNDPNQPMSGGYFFANSTPAAAAALPSQPAYKWIDPLSNNHTMITTWTTGNSNNGSFTLPNIGFDFSFFGTIYRNNIYVNSNGALHFGTANSSTGANEYIPNSSAPNNFLAVCLMDLAAGTDGKVYYGKSANGEYVVTWWHYHDVAPNGTTIDSAEYVTFQAILNPNGTIKVQFNDTESTANNGRVFDILNDALIGIEDATGTMGVQYRNNGGPAPMFSSPLAIAFALNNKLLPTQNLFNTEGVSVGDVFPNPSSNLFTFDFYTPQKMALTLKLSNSLGQVVWSETQNTQTGKQQKTVDWANLPSGVYWLSLATEQGQRFVQRVVRD